MCLRLRNRFIKFIVMAAACCGAALPATAQTAAPQLPSAPLTLEQTLEIAERRSYGIAIAREGVQRAEGDLVRARSGRFPQLSFLAGYDRALASEFEGVFDSFNFGNDTGVVDDGGFEDLPFGRANTWRATLLFSQSVYSGGRLGAQSDVALAGQDSAEVGVTTARAQLLFDATRAYFDAALAGRLVAIAQSTLEQADATLRQTQASYDAGTQPEFEVLRARVSRDNQTPVVIRQRIDREVAMLRLKQLLQLPVGYDLQLADTLGDEKLAPPPVFADRVGFVENAMPLDEEFTGLDKVSLPNRAVIDQADATIRLREASLRLIEAERKPNVALNSNYGRIAYPTDFFSPAFDRTNWVIGASVTVPILTGGRQRGDEMVARAELEQARLQRQQVEELAAVDTRSTWAELLAARARWAASAGTVQQATRAYEIADVRFRAGVSTQLELSDSRLALQLAEANRAVAARDLQVARARVALLPGLPLSPVTIAPFVAPVVTPAPIPAPAPLVPPQGPGGQFRNAAAQTGPAQAQAGLR